MKTKKIKIISTFNLNIPNGYKLNKYSIGIIKAGIKEALKESYAMIESDDCDSDCLLTRIKVK